MGRTHNTEDQDGQNHVVTDEQVLDALPPAQLFGVAIFIWKFATAELVNRENKPNELHTSCSSGKMEHLSSTPHEADARLERNGTRSCRGYTWSRSISTNDRSRRAKTNGSCAHLHTIMISGVYTRLGLIRWGVEVVGHKPTHELSQGQ